MASSAQPKSPESLRDALAAPLAALWGAQAFTLTRLVGDASTRIYHRLSSEETPPRTLIVMELPADPLRSDEVSGAERPRELPFYELQRFLAAGGLPVPTIHAYLREAGLLLLEDLGDVTLGALVATADDAARGSLYRQAIDLLLALQRYAAGAPQDCVCFQRRFDGALLRWELEHFREWLLEAQRGLRLGAAERRALDGQFDHLVELLLALPTVWVHRDYQSRNLMVQRGAGGEPRLRLIDFQDALIGPLVYDLVGLLRDSYVDLGLPLVEELLAHYHARATPAVSHDELQRMFWLQTVQRKLKDAGRFVFIERVRGNPSFLPYIPRSLGYVGQALARLPELAPLATLLGSRLPELRV
ncbi:MAG: phosphotransferase [Proteobacteria bacterium]|nr:phosphotransferase [Pseudomonadota bacterium]